MFLTKDASETRFIAFEIQRTYARTAFLVKHFLRLGAVISTASRCISVEIEKIKKKQCQFISSSNSVIINVLSRWSWPTLQNESNFYLKRWKSDLNKWTIDQKSCVYITELYQLKMFSHSKRNVFESSLHLNSSAQWHFYLCKILNALCNLSLTNLTA